MKKLLPYIIVPILLTTISTACGPSPADLDSTSTQIAVNIFSTQTAQAPTATATFTPTPTPTTTPTPTITPTSTPTYTPTPTKHPMAGEFVDGKLVMTDESFRHLTDIGQNLYSEGWYLYEALLYDAMLDYSLQSDQLITLYNLQSEDYEYLGHYDDAIEDYLKIINLGDRRAGFLNSLCWNYAITNQPELALPYCEEAVNSDPSAQTLDSRGVTYALLGRYPEAVYDIEAALEQDGWPTDEMKTQRQEWLTTLKSGNNPITEQVLENERGKEGSLVPEPWYTGDLTLSSLRKEYEDMGYVFEETLTDDQPSLTGTIQDGNCKADLVLLGDDQELKGGTITISGCSHDDLDGYAWDFIWPFNRDLDEMAHALVWHSADVYYVIEGKPVTDLSPTFGGFQFSVERVSIAGGEAVVVTAKPAE